MSACVAGASKSVSPEPRPGFSRSLRLRAVLFVGLSLLIGSAEQVAAQADDPYSQCARLLETEPLNQFGAQSESRDFSILSKNGAANALIGVQCSRDQIYNYFVDNGWIFKGEGNGLVTTDVGTYDHGISFCYPRKFPARLLSGRCSVFAAVVSLNEHVVNFYMHGSK
ncbi:hypothetical protein OEZ60_06270 [Defluviimonas sp. WL0024]|uniref:YARHG domain-containing protein n=1 Tax=Albidovulum salinarum TaxID=2984153 RepID=A0ABT2X0Z7_9RHOB|nr:hypothetical protein [Defluviimonas sp. WL0024]MCU9847607.1 hypothetical protein [Defluviimonas sp. WL0024]